MAIPTSIVTGTQTVTATGPVTPTAGVSVSGVTGDFTVCVLVSSLSVGQRARIQIEGSTNAFTNTTALAVFDVAGGSINPQAPVKQSWRRYSMDLQGTVFGAANGVVRLNVKTLTGGQLTLQSWYEA